MAERVPNAGSRIGKSYRPLCFEVFRVADSRLYAVCTLPRGHDGHHSSPRGAAEDAMLTMLFGGQGEGGE